MYDINSITVSTGYQQVQLHEGLCYGKYYICIIFNELMKKQRHFR